MNSNEFLIEVEFKPSIPLDLVTLEFPMDGDMVCEFHGKQAAVKFSNCRLCLECVKEAVEENGKENI